MTVVLLVMMLTLVNAVASNQEHLRHKRYLLFPSPGSKIQLITGFGVPAALGADMHLIFGTVFKANYRLPQNVSDIRDHYVTFQRKKRSPANRWHIYELLAKLIESNGFSGKPCILRTICEMARTPLAANEDLIHELLHVLFTPTTTLEAVENQRDSEYYTAQIKGRRGDEDCGRLYGECTISVADLMTTHGDVDHY